MALGQDYGFRSIDNLTVLVMLGYSDLGTALPGREVRRLPV